MGKQIFSKRYSIPLLIFISIFSFGLVWAMIVPGDNEAPDEAAHVNMISYLKENHQIPVFNQSSGIVATDYTTRLLSGTYYSMAYNSPLSYLPFIPFYPSRTGDIQKAAVLPSRVISSLFMALFAVFLFLGLTKIKPKNTTAALVTTLFIALIPQVIYSAGYINIEPIALMLAALAFYLYQRLQEKTSWTLMISFGLSVGLIGLLKANYYIIIGFLLLLIIYDLIKSKNRLRELQKYWPALVLFVAVNLWWWLRNWGLYHDPLILSYIKREIIDKAPSWIITHRAQGYNIVTIFGSQYFAKFTFFGFFANLGGANIYLPLIFYITFFLEIVLLGFSAFKNYLKNEKYLFSFLIIVIVSLIYYANKNLDDFSPQGRHLFPLMIPLATLIYFGLTNLKPRISRIANIFLPSFAILASLWGLLLTVDQYYVKGVAYANIANMVKFLPKFSWYHLSLANLQALYKLLELPPGAIWVMAFLVLVFIYCMVSIYCSLISESKKA